MEFVNNLENLEQKGDQVVTVDDSGDPSVPDWTRLPQSREDPVPGDVGSRHFELIDASHQQQHEMVMDKEH